MNNPTGKVNILLIAGICVILIVVGFFVYQTIINYQELLKEGGASKGEPASQEEEPIIKEETSTKETPTIMVSPALEKKSIVMIVAHEDFRDEEYFVPKQIFLAAGAEVKTASNQTGSATGAEGGTVPVDILIKDINIANFDAVVFIGGPGALKYLDNEDSYKVAREAVSQGKVLAAICISPTILAKAGVLEGKKATVWTSPLDKSAAKILEDNGALYQEEDVVADKNIITGSGPEVAEPFAMKVVEVLTNL